MTEFDGSIPRPSVVAELEDLREEFLKLQERVTDIRGRAEQISARVRSQNGAVAVSVGLHGDLQEIQLRPDAFRLMGPDQLARAIVETAHEAKAEAHREMEEFVSSFLPQGVSFGEFSRGEVDPRVLLERLRESRQSRAR